MVLLGAILNKQGQWTSSRQNSKKQARRLAGTG